MISGKDSDPGKEKTSKKTSDDSKKGKNLAPEKETMLRKVFERLVEDRKVTTQNDFAEKTKYHSTPVSLMLQGKKPTPYRFLVKLYNTFGININYLVSNGKGNIYLGEADMISVADIEQHKVIRARCETLEKENTVLKQQLIDKERIITLLEKR